MALELIGHNALEETFGDVNDQLAASMVPWEVAKPALSAVFAVGLELEMGCCSMDDENHAIDHHRFLHGQQATVIANLIVRVQDGCGNQN